MNSLSLTLICGMLVLLAATAFAGTVSFSYEEALKRTWTHEVLNFTVFVPETGTDLATLYVTDDAGAVIPAQISASPATRKPKLMPVVVTLIADYQPWQKHSWTLHYNETRPAMPPTDLTSKEEPGSYVLTNGLIAIRTGRGERHFSTSQDAVKVPAPLLAVRGRDGKWMGRGWLETPRRVIDYRITLTDDGPIFKRVRAHYQFDQGYYDCTVTLRAGEDVVHFHEEFDMGAPVAQPRQPLLLQLLQWAAAGYRALGRLVRRQAASIQNNARCGWTAAKEATLRHRLREARSDCCACTVSFYWWEQAACYYGAYRKKDATERRPAGGLSRSVRATGATRTVHLPGEPQRARNWW